MKAPAFQCYARDALVSTLGWSNEDFGIYWRLLLLQWDRGGLPGDEPSLRPLVGSRRPIPKVVLDKLPIDADGQRRNPRLERARAEQEAHRMDKIEAGRAGGKAKARRLALLKQKSSTATDSPLANGQQNVALHSASATAITPLNPPEGEGIEESAGAASGRASNGTVRAIERVRQLTNGGANDAF